MARPTTNYAHLCMLLEDILVEYRIEATILIHRFWHARTEHRRWRILEEARKYSVLNKIPDQLKRLDRLVNVTGADCLSNLRMDRNTFGKLCRILSERGGLDGRSGATVSNCVHKVLAAILSLHSVLLCQPTPVQANCNDHRWKWFKGCLGALDGTHINVLVSAGDKPRYRNRKGQIATNTLAACDRNMQFVYFLPGWEGSAGDSRVLRDAVSRPHGLKVPRGMLNE